jgi:tRNA-dihydrouridine synthase A
VYAAALTSGTKIFAVAPMINWTDRHCRYLHRQLSRHALLYTEMVVADAIIHGPRDRLLSHDPVEHPVALQLGGSDPFKMAQATRIALDYGYDEINMNVGCPSDRVQSGTFGACLMLEPDVVARCIAAMKSVSNVPVTVKCRIGVDDQDPEIALRQLAAKVFDAGADALWVHARKAWLQGLSPKENREIPLLNYDLVYRLKGKYPDRFIGINGGIETLIEAKKHLEQMDGVMLGRAAYHNASMLLEVDRSLFAAADEPVSVAVLQKVMQDYAARHMANGGRLHHITRHMVGLFQGQSGAKKFRQILSTDATRTGAGAGVIEKAFAVLRLDEDRSSANPALSASAE